MNGSSSTIVSLPGALAVLGALGSDTMGPVMLSQCLCPQSYGAVTYLSQILDGACQPMVGPTFKLGSMLTVHTACVIAGRINPWDPCAGFVPLREDQAQCYATDEGYKKQMGSCIYLGVLDHATAVAQTRRAEKILHHHYIRMHFTQNIRPSRRWLSARMIGASWPLVVEIIMVVLKEWLWASIILIGWIGWFFVSLSAGSDVLPKHRCDLDCVKQRRYLLNDQRVTKSLIDYTVCAEFDDEACQKMPKRQTKWCILRVVGGLLMTIHFPLGLVATCYNDSIGALLWVLAQFAGLLAGIRWWCRYHRLVRHGIDYGGDLQIDKPEPEVLSFETWQEVLDCVQKCHSDHIKHKYA